MSAQSIPPQTVAPSGRHRRLALGIGAVLVLAAAVAGLHRYVTLDALVGLSDRFHADVVDHWVLAIIGYLLVYTLAVALSFPGAVIFTLMSGLLFGWFVGGIVSVVAATAGASIVFAIARTAIGERLLTRAGPQANRLSDGFCRNGLSYMLFLRLVPAVPFFVVNVVPALLRVPFRTFVVGTFFGIMPACFTYSFAGAGLDSAIHAAKATQAACLKHSVSSDCPLSLSMGDLVTTEMKIALVMLGILALLPIGIRAWRRRHGD